MSDPDGRCAGGGRPREKLATVIAHTWKETIWEFVRLRLCNTPAPCARSDLRRCLDT